MHRMALPLLFLVVVFSGPSASCRALATSASESAPHYAEADIISLQESSDSSAHSITAVDINLFAGTDSSLREFPRQKLTFKEKLGEGQFGEVHSVLWLALIFCSGDILNSSAWDCLTYFYCF